MNNDKKTIQLDKMVKPKITQYYSFIIDFFVQLTIFGLSVGIFTHEECNFFCGPATDLNSVEIVMVISLVVNIFIRVLSRILKRRGVIAYLGKNK